MTDQAVPWTYRVEVFLWYDLEDGQYAVRAYNAQEQILTWPDTDATYHHLEAAGERGAQIEATTLLQSLGYEPAGRWATDSPMIAELAREPADMIRLYRRSRARAAS